MCARFCSWMDALSLGWTGEGEEMPHRGDEAYMIMLLNGGPDSVPKLMKVKCDDGGG